MAYCGKCGMQVNAEVKFCPGCGTPMGTQVQTNQTNQTNQQNGIGAKVSGLNNTADHTAEFAQEDIATNKVMAILAYFGPLVFIPMFAAPESKFTRYHANQGLVLLILDVAYVIVQTILMAILRGIFPWNWNYGYFGGRGAVFSIFSAVLSLVWIGIGILAIIGVINAVQGRAKELPIIGKIKILK